jgi:hypothetical protein
VDEDLKLKQKAFYLQPDCRRFWILTGRLSWLTIKTLSSKPKNRSPSFAMGYYILASFSEISSSHTTRVFLIKRDLNGVAQECPRQGLRQSLTQPIFSCLR